MKYNKLKRFLTCGASATVAFSMAAAPMTAYANEINPIEINQEKSETSEEKNGDPSNSNTVSENSSSNSDNSSSNNISGNVDSGVDNNNSNSGTEENTSGGDINSSDSGSENGDSDVDNNTSENEPGSDISNGDNNNSNNNSENRDNNNSNSESEDNDNNSSNTDAKVEDNNGDADTSKEEVKEENQNSVSEDQLVLEEKESDKKAEEVSSGIYYQSKDKYEVPVYLYDNFRFWTVEKVYSFANKDIDVLDDMKDDAETIGTLKYNDVAYILLTDQNDEWAFIESGEVRGFVKTEDLFRNEKAEAILLEYQKEAKAETDEEKEAMDFAGHVGETVVDKTENKAFTYVRMTTHKVVIDKLYARPVMDNVDVKEGKSDDARTVGTIEKDGLAYVIADSEEDWIYVESGDVRGFVRKEQISFSDEVQKEIEKNGEDTYTEGIKKVEPLDNKAMYYTITSIKEGERCSDTGLRLLNFASQFIGNKYVWGGTSLTNGADCSGFVQSVFKEFGYALPRVAADQAEYGEKISVEEAVPGDLIFYGDESGIYHVVIYAGDGKTIEANSEDYGIGCFNLDYTSAKWAVRVLADNDKIEGRTGKLIKVPEQLGHIYTYMGWQCVTAVNSEQYKLRNTFGMNFNDEGFGVINGRYVIATTTTFGNVGDEIDIYLEDGTILPCIIGDIKNQGDVGCTIWGHINGENMVEFVVDRDLWYENSYPNPGTESFHPELSQYVEKAINLGSVLN